MLFSFLASLMDQEEKKENTTTFGADVMRSQLSSRGSVHHLKVHLSHKARKATVNQQWAYHKVGLNSLAHLHLSGITNHLVLAHKGETVADGGCLAKANRPPDCLLSQGSKVALDHWYHPAQVRLQITCAGLSSRRSGLLAYLVPALWAAASSVVNRNLNEIVMVSQQAYDYSINLCQHDILNVKLAEQASRQGCPSSMTRM